MLNGMLKRVDVSLAAFVIMLGIGSVGGDAQAAIGDSPQAITYWIEVVRGAETMHVTQKMTFKTGDKIKFHVKPSVDGYAYVVLKSGSLGEKAVLFPVERLKDNNHLAKGVDIAIPSDDYMVFDADPGTEHVCLTFSRTPIDPKSLLGDGMRPDDTKVVMRAQAGSKDLVPAKIKVVYSAPVESGVMSDATRAEKLKKYAPAGISYVPGTAAAAHGASTPAAPIEDSAGEVTVTQSEPGNMLNIDVDLSHAS
ncbi:MAG: DUF4384 domain-containing protein [Candidatus Obscuribacterales bacterium]|nr:DUF4384 domain-containing protein [Candidatus Obscuribacterales bacterium]